MRTPYAISAPLLAAALLVSGCSSSTDDGGAPATKAKAGKEVLFGASCKEAAHDAVFGANNDIDPRKLVALGEQSPEDGGIKEPSALEMGAHGGTILNIPASKIDALQTSWEKLFEKADPEKLKTDSSYSSWQIGFYGDPDTKPDGRLAEGTYLCAYSDWTTRGDGPDVIAS
ncbi:hypothetical protein [Tsukamurella spumae]|uniref:DUF3558 domain-containing protein n=1 Tax=Tsukamurella spumae TaxID=44753 RepID=A0A846X3H4_9ACTN|nr:hypothetical protein [Tsukamurella spumae]NKY18879.1 hypothetical protein [Tsukamurella spumae]